VYLSLEDQDEAAARALHLNNIENIIEISVKSNAIFPGTVIGLEIPPSDILTTIEDMKNIYSNLVGINDTFPFEIGIFQSDCLNFLKNNISEGAHSNFDLSLINFLMCYEMPKKSSSVEKSADIVVEQLHSIQMTLRQSNFNSIKVIGRTGWPSARTSDKGAEGSIENMKRFWCQMYKRLEEYSNPLIDIYSAFDDSTKLTKPQGASEAEYHYGWWERRHDNSSDPDAFLEKIKRKLAS